MVEYLISLREKNGTFDIIISIRYCSEYGIIHEGLEYTTPAHASLISCMIRNDTSFCLVLGKEQMNIYKSFSILVAMSGALILFEIDNLDLKSELFLSILIFINFSCFGLF